MASTINASNGSTSGLITTGDTSGVLQLQVNDGTPAVTLNTAGAMGVGSTPGYGTSGQVLTSGGSSAAPTWGTLIVPTTNGSSGEVLTSNGTATPIWSTPASGSLLRLTTFTSSGTWTKGANTNFVKVTVTGGGGGGAGGLSGSTNAYGASGGAAGTAIKFIDVSAISTVSVTVGTGGSGGSVGSGGTTGNDSSFGTHCTGNGGNAASDSYTQGDGGSATSGNINIGGGSGIPPTGSGTSNTNKMPGGASFWGGSSPSAGAYGSGGAGGQPNNSGYAGKSGIVVIEEFA